MLKLHIPTGTGTGYTVGSLSMFEDKSSLLLCTLSPLSLIFDLN
jgi:hypothetical protein